MESPEVPPQPRRRAPTRLQFLVADLADAEGLLLRVDVSAKRVPDGMSRFGSPPRPLRERRFDVGGVVGFALRLDVLAELLFRYEHSVAVRALEAELLFEVVAEILVA